MMSIEEWLDGLGLAPLNGVFAENDIDLAVVRELTDADLRELGLSLGHRKKLMKAIAELQAAGADAGDTHPPAARGRVGAERRQLTVMFCDLVGSTQLSARLDPEDLRDVIRAYQERCTAIVGEFEGHVGNYVGDGILVYFGYPRAHEDDAQRAVHAALGICEAMRRLGGELGLDGIELAVRIGIETGVVIAGDIGTGEIRDELAVVGETPNVAARLQSLAQPNTVVIGKTTRRLVDGLFVLEDLGPQPLRGIAEPVQTFCVRGESDALSRFEAHAERGLTPLVGREEEMRLLLARWERAREGDGHVVLLSGEAGIGKSRMLQVLRDAMRDQTHTIVRQFCSPFYAKTALHPMLEQLERASGLRRDDPVETKLDKLEELLGQATDDPAGATAVIASLMSIPTGERYPPLDLAPQQLKARAFEILVEQLMGLARRQPVLMIIEDVHWIDPSTMEFYQRFVGRAERVPVLIIMTFRPEFEPPFAGHPNVTSLSLTRLGQREAEAMVLRVTGNKQLPAEVLERIVARTDGVPLFVEELTKNVLESPILEDAGDRYVLTGPLPSLEIPASLHDSLMARLDRLAPVKELAQLAATLGRNFSQELIEAVADLQTPALGAALAQLIEAELLYRRGVPPSIIYDFKHALVQDVAYGSLLRPRRQYLHQRIATVLETQFPETAEAKPELLAHHFREAGQPAKALPHALRAGDLAVSRYAYAEARTQFEDALEMTARLGDAEATERARLDVIIKLAGVALNRVQFETDLRRLREAEHAAESLGDQRSLCQILYWIGRLNYVVGRFDLGVDYARRALAIGDDLEAGSAAAVDRLTAAPVNLLARLHCLRGEAREAITQAERSVLQMAQLGDRTEQAAVSGVLAFAYGMHGDFTAAFAAAQQGVDLALEVDHLPTIAACWHFLAVVKGWHGDLPEALPAFEEALLAADQGGDVFRRYLAHGWRGEAYLLAGRLGPAERDLSECLALGEEIGTSFHRGAFEAFLARIRLLRRQQDEALELSRHAVELAADPANAWSRSIALRIHAEALLRAGTPPDQVLTVIDEAILLQEERGCRFDLAWSRLARAEVMDALGDAERAERERAIAESALAEMGIGRRADTAEVIRTS
jgi:class 3 adenylate cyclase/tetratricopeptide (TPR) repeat protein